MTRKCLDCYFFNGTKIIEECTYKGECIGYDKWTGHITAQDNINHPSHYTFGTIEVIDVIEDWQLPYHIGNVIKYVARVGKKDKDKTLEDLKKAQWYLNRYIQLQEEDQRGSDKG